MADSRRSPPADSARAPGAIDTVRDAVRFALATHVGGGAPVAVALSGGRDSMALLDACDAVATPLGIALYAIHVHHGLVPEAEDWATFCVAQCTQRGHRCVVHRAVLPAHPRAGVEAAARHARYDALADEAHAIGVAHVLLGHHENDQAETLFLQLARGAGPHGLAAMAALSRSRGVTWLRPLLDLPRDAIDRYVHCLRIPFVDDASNSERRYRRNALRLAVPALASVIPGYPRTLARAARHQAAAAELIDDLAAIDARGAFADGMLVRARLIELAPHRQRNLLRWFLCQQGLRAPGTARLAAMLRQLTTAREDARIRLAHEGREIGVHQGLVVVHAPAPPKFDLPWCGEPMLQLPHGTLHFVPAAGDGLAIEHVAGRRLRIRSRGGGERIRLSQRAPRRTLKNVLQEAGIAPWQREGLPLVFHDDALAMVPGVGVDVAFRAAAGRPGLRVEWRERTGSSSGPRPVDSSQSVAAGWAQGGGN